MEKITTLLFYWIKKKRPARPKFGSLSAAVLWILYTDDDDDDDDVRTIDLFLWLSICTTYYTIIHGQSGKTICYASANRIEYFKIMLKLKWDSYIDFALNEKKNPPPIVYEILVMRRAMKIFTQTQINTIQGEKKNV